MTWIILEGLDRTGKSSVAELYKKQGYQVVHMSAPDKKYTTPGYAGPSYLDYLVELYSKHDGVDVVWDRSPYGELVWPSVYNRPAQLDDDGIDMLREYEDQNSVQRIVMFDQNIEAHWKRCVDNKEPMNRSQFNTATLLFNKLAKQHTFEKKQLTDFAGLADVKVQDKQSEPANNEATVDITINSSTAGMADFDSDVVDFQKTAEQLKLDKANAINQILSKRIIKPKGEPFDSIEKELRVYLNRQLGVLFGQSPVDGLTPQELEVLKLTAQQILKKQKGA